MGCGGSKSTEVSTGNERARLIKDGDKTSPKPDEDNASEKNTPGYSKLPQEDNGEAPAKSGKDSAPEPVSTEIEENQPPEKTTTNYTKLPPAAEDKEAPAQEDKETSKPDKIEEENEVSPQENEP